MSLLIACMLIYHYQLEWWWYLYAGLIYYGEAQYVKSNFDHFRKLLLRLIFPNG
jgi:hypothetical protein